jgi:glycine/serine hydroxymethyltransferase
MEVSSEAADAAKDTTEDVKEARKRRAESAKDTSAKGLGSSESDITKKIDSDVFSTNEFLDTDESREDAAHKGEQIFYDCDEKINAAVFPGLQGGLHNHTITGLAVALK